MQFSKDFLSLSKLSVIENFVVSFYLEVLCVFVTNNTIFWLDQLQLGPLFFPATRLSANMIDREIAKAFRPRQLNASYTQLYTYSSIVDTYIAIGTCPQLPNMQEPKLACTGRGNQTGGKTGLPCDQALLGQIDHRKNLRMSLVNYKARKRPSQEAHFFPLYIFILSFKIASR